MNLMQWTDQELQTLARKGLRRELRQVRGRQASRIEINGREVLNFCSNNYLGLADDERISRRVSEYLMLHGFGAGASRLVCGNMDAHVALEEEIARFKGMEACLLFSCGYMANIGILSALLTRSDVVFSDRLNHASLVDGIQLSRAMLKRYPHNDMKALEGLLQHTSATGKRLIVTDSVFSMDGDIAPLDEIVTLAEKYEAAVMIDEAHALGVMGENGKGLAEHFGVEDKVAIQMGTLSKAAGTYGAYCCGSKSLIDVLRNTARSFIYTTALPGSVAEAGRCALEVMQEEGWRRQALADNITKMRQLLGKAGIRTLGQATPIIPVLVNDNEVAVKFSQQLFEEGILIGAIRPPTVPQGTARLRLTVMATHTPAEIKFVAETMVKIGKQLCLI